MKILKKYDKQLSRNFNNLAYFCKRKDYYCRKRDIISLSTPCNRNQLAFVYRQIAYFNEKIDYSFAKQYEICDKANAIIAEINSKASES
jgi:hypothetical protein